MKSFLIAISLAIALLTACAPAPAPLPTATPTVLPTATFAPAPTATQLTAKPTPTLKPLSLEERKNVFEQTWALVRDHWVYNDDFRGLNWQQVHDEFAPRVASANTSESFYALLREMVYKLDDNHSRFYSPQEVAFQKETASINSVFGGIGIGYMTESDHVVILRIAKGGPADTAGLKIGDSIQTVDGVPVSTLEASNPGGAGAAIRGDIGTTVRLSVQSFDGKPISLNLVRRAVSIDDTPQVSRLAGTQVGLLVISSFGTNDMDLQVKTQLQKLLQAGPLDGLVIDIRTNGGGTLSFAGTLALFNDGGTIGTFGTRKANTPYTIKSGNAIQELKGVPMVVLTSSATASAAEWFASGMQVLKRARIVGMPSKGVTQRIGAYNLPDGSLLGLADQTYQRPDGSIIDGKGVQPDRVVDVKWYPYLNNPSDDPQIKAALEELKKK